MKKIALLIIVFMVMGVSQTYACCGAAMAEYNNVNSSNTYYQRATEAAEKYLIGKTVNVTQNNKTMTTGRGIDPNNNFGDDSSTGKWGSYITNQQQSVISFLRVVFMFDHDANNHTGADENGFGGDGDIVDNVNWGNHAAGYVSPACQLNGNSTASANTALNTCQHHEDHWVNTIQPNIQTFTTQGSGS